MSPDLIKRVMAGLLVASGLLHVIVALVGDIGSVKHGLTLLGIAYFLLGLFLIPGKRTAVLTAMVMTGLGLGLAGQNYLANGGPMTLPAIFALDILILLAGAWWLMKTNRPARD